MSPTAPARRAACLAAALAGAALVAACGSSSSSSATSRPVLSVPPTTTVSVPSDPCTMLAPAQIEQATKMKVGPGVPSSSVSVSGATDASCTWTDASQVAYVSVGFNTGFTKVEGFDMGLKDPVSPIASAYGEGKIGGSIAGAGARALLMTPRGAIDLIYSPVDPEEAAATSIAAVKALVAALGG